MYFNNRGSIATSTAETTLQGPDSDRTALFLYLMPLEMAFFFEYHSRTRAPLKISKTDKLSDIHRNDINVCNSQVGSDNFSLSVMLEFKFKFAVGLHELLPVIQIQFCIFRIRISKSVTHRSKPGEERSVIKFAFLL